MKICVVIPMYGKQEYTDKCLQFVRDNAGIEHDVLVVDDGSKVPYKQGDVEVLRLEKNSGFTNAVNQGILLAQKRNYDYVVLLNNDTEPEPNFLKELVDTMQDEKVGIAVSVRRHTNRAVECIELCNSDIIRGFQYFADESKLPHTPFEINSAALCCALFRMDMVRELGLLDKRMINHCSDTDYCFRAKFNHWKVMLVPKSIVLHHLSVTTTANNIVVDDDQRIMLEKIAGLDYAKLCASMPLDGEAKTWGRHSFEVYQK